MKNYEAFFLFSDSVCKQQLGLNVVLSFGEVCETIFDAAPILLNVVVTETDTQGSRWSENTLQFIIHCGAA